MFITELSVEKTEVKTQALRNHTSFTFWWQRERYGSRKGTIQKCFTNPKKYSESISFRQIAFEKFVKSTKQIQIRDFLHIYRALKTLDLADLYFFNPLERLDISGSNSPLQFSSFSKKKKWTGVGPLNIILAPGLEFEELILKSSIPTGERSWSFKLIDA